MAKNDSKSDNIVFFCSGCKFFREKKNQSEELNWPVYDVYSLHTTFTLLYIHHSIHTLYHQQQKRLTTTVYTLLQLVQKTVLDVFDLNQPRLT